MISGEGEQKQIKEGKLNGEQYNTGGVAKEEGKCVAKAKVIAITLQNIIRAIGVGGCCYGKESDRERTI